MFPCVERRSPAIRTPPGYLSATMVVPWGNWSPDIPPLTLAGSRSGAWRRSKSANDDRSTAGNLGDAGLVDKRSGNGQVTVRPFEHMHARSPRRFLQGRR